MMTIHKALASGTSDAVEITTAAQPGATGSARADALPINSELVAISDEPVAVMAAAHVTEVPAPLNAVAKALPASGEHGKKKRGGADEERLATADEDDAVASVQDPTPAEQQPANEESQKDESETEDDGGGDSTLIIVGGALLGPD